MNLFNRAPIFLLLSLTVMISATACDNSNGPLESDTASIAGNRGKGGILAKAGDPGTQSTVALLTPNPYTGGYAPVCTGSIIDKNLVITAAHCVRNLTADGQYNDIQYIGFGFDTTKKTIEKRKVAQILFHLNSWMHYKNNVELNKRLQIPLSDLTQDESDVALIEFNGDLPAGYEPIPLISSPEAVKAGTEIRILGYGVIEVTKTNSSGLLRYGMVTSRGVRSATDFTAAPVSPLTYDTCNGDSGGPALVQEDGIWKLAGITSTGLAENGYYCERGGDAFALVSAFPDWIQTAKTRLSQMETKNSVTPIAHPLDEASEDFVNFVKDCEQAEPTSDEGHTYQLFMALAQQTSCPWTARVVLGFSHLTLDFTKSKYLGDNQTVLYNVGDEAKTPIKSVKPFSYLNHLLVLSLANHQIDDLKPLSKLSNVWSLSLSNNALTSTQLAELNSFRSANLNMLTLSSNKLTALNGLEQLPELAVLFVGNNQLNDLTAIAPLKHLEMLLADSNQIEDLQPLAGLSELSLLSLGKNVISDLAPLANLTGLTTLGLSNNQIEDITPLSNLIKLQYLDLRNNPQIKSKTCPVPESSGQQICKF